MLKLVDTHAHLNDSRYEDLNVLQENWQKNGISAVFTVSYNVKSIKQSLEIADRMEDVYAVIGIHPDDAEEYSEEVESLIEKLSSHPKVVAIGEIGLDYHYLEENREDKIKKQKEVFIRQLKLANKLRLPVEIHLRDALYDMLEILNQNKKYLEDGGVIHCYSEDYNSFLDFKKLGFVVGIGGIVTFKNGYKLAEVVEKMDICDFVLETDCPYLTPHPYRGKFLNEPKYIATIAEKVAEIKGVPVEKLSEETNKNIKRIFKKFKG